MIVADTLTALGGNTLLLNVDTLYSAIKLKIDLVLLVPALVSHGKFSCIVNERLGQLGPVDRDVLFLADDFDWSSIAGLGTPTVSMPFDRLSSVSYLSEAFNGKECATSTSYDNNAILVALHCLLGGFGLAAILLDLFGIGTDIDIGTFDFEFVLLQVLRRRGIFDITGLAVEACSVPRAAKRSQRCEPPAFSWSTHHTIRPR